MTLRYLVLLLLLFLMACTGQHSILSSEKPIDLRPISYQMAEQMHRQVSDTDASRYPMLATTFVNSADMERTNDLGKLLSEQVASRLSQLGYSIVEMQLTSSQLAIKPNAGVFALSRDLSVINTDISAYSVLVGTYTTINRQIYVNARILRVQDGVALGSADASLPYVRSKERGSPGMGVQVNAKTRLKEKD